MIINIVLGLLVTTVVKVVRAAAVVVVVDFYFMLIVSKFKLFYYFIYFLLFHNFLCCGRIRQLYSYKDQHVTVYISLKKMTRQEKKSQSKEKTIPGLWCIIITLGNGVRFELRTVLFLFYYFKK